MRGMLSGPPHVSWGLPHVAWGGGPMTPMVIPMEAWISKRKAANQTASRDEGPDQT
jgi:hypothetical protein